MLFRVIARLDVKPPNLVKGIHMEGLRKLGNPGQFAQSYYAQGADEINYQDIVASLYDRNSIASLISETADSVFVPITVGGGIRKVEDATSLTRSGADKICINTAAVRNPEVIAELSGVLGRQAVVVGIEAKSAPGGWIAMTDCGREHTGRNVVDWVKEVEDIGAGEILLTSIDREGTMQGFDLPLLEAVRSHTDLPVIAHGGAGSSQDIAEAHASGANAVAVASILHFGRCSVTEIKRELADRGVEVRP